MITLVFMVTTAICAVNWLKWKVSAKAVTYFFAKSGCIPPNKEEIKECTAFVIKQMINVNRNKI